MKKMILLTAFVAVVLGISTQSQAYTQGSQHAIAKKWADPDQAPVVMFDPDTGAALGYILYADLDGNEGDEIIIPYKTRIKVADRESKASAFMQVLSLDVIRNDKKIRGFIEIELAYAYTPRPYVTAERVFPNEPAKLFLMVYDGIDKKDKVKQADKRLTILWNGMAQADKDREKQEFESVKMPWKFILRQFASGTPTVTEFYSKTDESWGKFYIRTLLKGEAWPPIPMKDIKAFEDEVKKYQDHIFWEYSY
ncbi:MAG TPA: hypothetical protein P5511_00175 [Candidatus Goldiibacteriota bacterium]|nr:hypothetical protein [Candidatus Goldiibacteriota bacterium]